MCYMEVMRVASCPPVAGGNEEMTIYFPSIYCNEDVVAARKPGPESNHPPGRNVETGEISLIHTFSTFQLGRLAMDEIEMVWRRYGQWYKTIASRQLELNHFGCVISYKIVHGIEHNTRYGNF